ncbi:hypothetical protein [Phormidium tenue]|uniref:hypothetical protein n=1 Tax=Phormidium tenue TaxID=126344 RepID=UPI0015C53C8A|nr:hypothetical protein [Phormidium tenue]
MTDKLCAEDYSISVVRNIPKGSNLQKVSILVPSETREQVLNKLDNPQKECLKPNFLEDFSPKKALISWLSNRFIGYS